MTTDGSAGRTGTAFLTLDFATYIVDNYSHDPGVAQNAAKALRAARDAGMPVFHVAPGPMTEQLHPLVERGPHEPVLAKSTFSAFAGTDLDQRLRDAGVGRIVIAGVATSGTVLSTARWAHDIGYQVAICADACADPDAQAHAALLDPSVFPDSWLGLWRIARITTSADVTEVAW
ncbi:cysteine hydrolase [Actinocorallia longicatena]|uniref:Isochorismatase-like domain-containing protein n=1 Tax=Actinocorallia longicatena TaxID=111803 RepID=A0ABP6QCJ4_9ACTN